jgi:hypothetical protein
LEGGIILTNSENTKNLSETSNTRTIYRSLFSIAVVIAVGAAVVTFAGTNEPDPLQVGPNPAPYIEEREEAIYGEDSPYDFDEDMEQDKEQNK